MSSFSVVLFLLIGLCFVVNAQKTHSKKRKLCGEECKFRFCRANRNGNVAQVGTTIRLRSPNTAVNPYICMLDGSVGRVIATGVASIRTNTFNNAMVPINQWSPLGLDTPFPRRFFYGRQIPGLKLAGLAHLKPKGNQYSYLNDQCFTLPITKYEEVNTNTGEVVGEKTPSGFNNCVSFRTLAHRMLVELFWESSDDLDLVVREPDGDILSRTNPISTTGQKRNDNGKDGCGEIKVAKEGVIWRDEVEPGTYVVRVIQYKNCLLGKAKFTLRVTLDGQEYFKRTGFADGADMSVAGIYRFRI